MIVKSLMDSRERLALIQVDAVCCLLTSAHCFICLFAFDLIVVAWHACTQSLEPQSGLGWSSTNLQFAG